MSGRGAKIGVALLLLLGLGAAFLFDLHDYVTLERLKEQRAHLLAFRERNYVLTVVLFMLAFGSTAFAVPGAIVFSLAAGLLFGTLQGALYIDVAATVGAVTAFLLSRYLAADWFERRYVGQSRWLRSEIEKHGKYYVMFLRIVPVMPFFVVNYLTALTGMRATTFAWTTAVGMLPGAFVYANAGKHLAQIRSGEDILSWPMVVSVGLLGLLSISPIVWRVLQRPRS